MVSPPTRIAVNKLHAKAPKCIRVHFEHLPALVSTTSLPLDVALAYAFAQLELAHNMALYCGVVKLHRAHSELARSVVNTHHMTRDGFRERLALVVNKPIPDSVANKLKPAAKTRDRVMHGKVAKAAEIRTALAAILSYAEALNNFLKTTASYQPFGDLRGFKGRAQSLDKQTTRWVLKGMGFAVS